VLSLYRYATNCPQCRLVNLDTAAVCDCGCDLSGVATSPPATRSGRKASGLIKALLWIALSIALSLLIWLAYYLHFYNRLSHESLAKLTWFAFLIALGGLFGGLIWASITPVIAHFIGMSSGKPVSTRLVLITFFITGTISASVSGKQIIDKHPKLISAQRSVMPSNTQQDMARMEEIMSNVLGDAYYLTPSVLPNSGISWRVMMGGMLLIQQIAPF
jgi:hypothetical protein